MKKVKILLLLVSVVIIMEIATSISYAKYTIEKNILAATIEIRLKQ